MARTIATFTVEIEITVSADPDSDAFAVDHVQLVTGYDGAKKMWIMSPTYQPEDLEAAVQAHLRQQAEDALNDQAVEDCAQHADSRADVAFEGAWS